MQVWTNSTGMSEVRLVGLHLLQWLPMSKRWCWSSRARHSPLYAGVSWPGRGTFQTTAFPSSVKSKGHVCVKIQFHNILQSNYPLAVLQNGHYQLHAALWCIRCIALLLLGARESRQGPSAVLSEGELQEPRTHPQTFPTDGVERECQAREFLFLKIYTDVCVPNQTVKSPAHAHFSWFICTSSVHSDIPCTHKSMDT